MFSPITGDDRIAAVLQSFDGHSASNAYLDSLEAIAKELRARILADSRIHLHDVRPRVKKRDSLLKKLRKDPFREVEDILGLRVITYFRDDAIWVEQVVRGMLKVREGTYSNKADNLHDREFGYRSIQFIATVPPGGYGTTWEDDLRNAIASPEMSPEIVEIQIRSVLEHGWAEAEHGLYANRHEPEPERRSVRRRFALTAALVEAADEQLEMLRDELALDRPDDESDTDDRQEGFVQRFFENERASIDLDDQISAALDIRKRRPQKYSREVSRAVLTAGIRSSSDLRRALQKHARLALRMAIVCVDVEHALILPDAFHEHDDHPESYPGIGIYWLSLALVHQYQDPIFSFNSVSDARLMEYRDVGRYLFENPDESALSVRERYFLQRHPTGGKGLREHKLELVQKLLPEAPAEEAPGIS